MFSPPLMISSLMRPVTKKKPSASRWPRSPVRSQPSGVNAAAWPAGSCSSRASRSGRGSRSRPSRRRPPAAARRRSRRPRSPRRRPTEPILRCAASSGLENAGATVSVRPMVSMTPMPNLLLEAAQVLGRQRGRGRAAEANAAPAPRRAGASPSSRYEMIVGTTLSQVQPESSACDQKRAAENAAPSPRCRRCASGASIVTAKALMWYSGSTPSTRSAGVSACSAADRPARWPPGWPASASRPWARRSCPRCTSAAPSRRAPAAGRPRRSRPRPRPAARAHRDRRRAGRPARSSRSSSARTGASQLGRDERPACSRECVEHVAHLLGLRQQVHRVDAAPAPQRAEQQAQRAQAVGHHQRHRVAGRDTVALQQRADAPAAGSEFAVARCAPSPSAATA